LASVNYYGLVELWDVESGDCLYVLDKEGRRLWAAAAAFSHDDRMLATSGVEGINIWSRGSEDTERVRTSYRLTAAGLEVTDEVMTKEGGWRVFGRSRLSRAP
jgi:hypothetical protein